MLTKQMKVISSRFVDFEQRIKNLENIASNFERQIKDLEKIVTSLLEKQDNKVCNCFPKVSEVSIENKEIDCSMFSTNTVKHIEKMKEMFFITNPDFIEVRDCFNHKCFDNIQKLISFYGNINSNNFRKYDNNMKYNVFEYFKKHVPKTCFEDMLQIKDTPSGKIEYFHGIIRGSIGISHLETNALKRSLLIFYDMTEKTRRRKTTYPEFNPNLHPDNFRIIEKDHEKIAKQNNNDKRKIVDQIGYLLKNLIE